VRDLVSLTQRQRVRASEDAMTASERAVVAYQRGQHAAALRAIEDHERLSREIARHDAVLPDPARALDLRAAEARETMFGVTR
jgi:hypothetical protein